MRVTRRAMLRALAHPLPDRRGAIAVMTAVVLPAIMLTLVGGVSLSAALSKRQALRNVAEVACSRMIRPLRMTMLSDDVRAQRAQETFDALAADEGLTVTQRAVSGGFLSGTVTATASVPIVPGAIAEGATAIDVHVNVACAGVPPFPKVGDVILSSNFTRPDGEELPMKYDGEWGVYQATEFGWEGGSGPGVEIQDWGGWGGFYGSQLPPGPTSRYVVELDSDADGTSFPPGTGNSSMYRTIELHRGTYTFSLWYVGRVNDLATNIITVSLEGILPASPVVEKMRLTDLPSAGWRYRSFDITVDTYSLYRLTIAAAGTDDSRGGNFNDLRLTYVAPPAP